MFKQPIYKPKAQQSKKLIHLVGVVLFLFIWQILSLIIDNQVLLPGPAAVMQTLGKLTFESPFWLSILYSLLTITSGFIVGALLAIILGHLSYFFSHTEALFTPLIYIFKSAPLAALTIILMIWLKTSVLPFVLILMAIIPPIYYATKSGLEGSSAKLLEMAFVFNMSRFPRYRTIYLPALIKELIPSLNYTTGLAWKAGITGEIMTQPISRLGTNLYDAKIQLESAEVLAHLALILLLAFILNKVVYLLSQALLQDNIQNNKEDISQFEENIDLANSSDQSKLTEHFQKANLQSVSSIQQNITHKKSDISNFISIKNINKSYNDKKVLSNFSCEIPQGLISFITGSTGKGKTTFFRLLTGLEQPDSGEIEFLAKPIFSYAFQDVRLLENFTLSENLMFTCNYKSSEPEALEFLAHWESIITDLGLPLTKKIKSYSGGMKQKASLIRALAYDSNIIVLDEVFRELDLKSEQQIIKLLVEEKGERTVLIASHRQDLIEQLADKIISL